MCKGKECEVRVRLAAGPRRTALLEDWGVARGGFRHSHREWRRGTQGTIAAWRGGAESAMPNLIFEAIGRSREITAEPIAPIAFRAEYVPGRPARCIAGGASNAGGHADLGLGGRLDASPCLRGRRRKGRSYQSRRTPRGGF